MSEQLQTDIEISDDGIIEGQNNIIDLTDKKPADVQPEGQPYTYGGDAGDLKIGANPNDIVLQAKAQGNYPNPNN